MRFWEKKAEEHIGNELCETDTEIRPIISAESWRKIEEKGRNEEAEVTAAIREL